MWHPTHRTWHSLQSYSCIRKCSELISYDIRTAQELLGNKNVNTTMIYTHVMCKGAGAVKSPLNDHG